MRARLRDYLGIAVFGAAFLVLGAAHLAGVAPRAPAAGAAACLAVALAGSLLSGLGKVRRKLLWRIRRKLVLSYVLIAFVPLLLVTGAVVMLAYVGLGQVLGYLGWRSLNNLVREVDDVALAIAARVAPVAEGAADIATLRRALASPALEYPELVALRARYPAVQAAVVVSDRAAGAVVPPGFEWGAGVKAGRPDWLGDGRFAAGVVLAQTGDLELRAATLRPAGAYAAYVEVAVPLGQDALDALGAPFGGALRVVEQDHRPDPARRRGSGAGPRVLAQTSGRAGPLPVFGVLPLHPRRWSDGTVPDGRDYVLVSERAVGGLFRDLQAFQPESEMLIRSLLAVVLVAFLAIEGASLWLGIRLARSITGAVHDISEGARRVEQGDFDYRFQAHDDDQLGALGRTFNQMAAAVKQQVVESAERERLEEELRIGRRIQQSLLPRGDWQDDGFEIAAVSLPAREVGGDYYDFFDLGAERLAVLVADVSGKGTEAAFYMAEVKGVMLALARPEASPRQVLAEANRLLGRSLDRRTFVTMTYAVIDRKRRELAFGRAGHCPLLHLPSGEDQVRCLRPGGLSLGIDRHGRFGHLLEERSLPLLPGDLVLFYTDGVTDTLGNDGELYGEARLAQALLAARSRPADAVRDALFADLRRFAVAGPPHDDLTVIVLRVR